MSESNGLFKWLHKLICEPGSEPRLGPSPMLQEHQRHAESYRECMQRKADEDHGLAGSGHWIPHLFDPQAFVEAYRDMLFRVSRDAMQGLRVSIRRPE